MLKQSDRDYVKKRKRMWDIMGFHSKGTGYLSKNGSLNCGCAMCRMDTYYNRLELKKKRLSAK